jgi:exosortase
VTRQHVTLGVLTLLLCVYLSGFLKQIAVSVLLKISLALTAALFWALRVPVEYRGHIMNLNHLTVEISEGCSGIRSLMPMIIIALAAAYLYLKTARSQVFFIGIAMVLTIVMNSVRIVTLTLLGAYVDPSFLMGALHGEGSLVFFLLSMVLLAPIMLLLTRGERELGTLETAPSRSVS